MIETYSCVYAEGVQSVMASIDTAAGLGVLYLINAPPSCSQTLGPCLPARMKRDSAGISRTLPKPQDLFDIYRLRGLSTTVPVRHKSPEGRTIVHKS